MAQKDTLPNTLQEVLLVGDKLSFAKPGQQEINTNDTLIPGGFSATFSDVLSVSAANHVRSFGPGLSATFSTRGSSSAQVNLYWHDLPLNSPALGSTDISLLPSSGFQASEMIGGNSSIFGNAAMGAVVTLDSRKLPQEKNIAISAGLGSFGNYFGGGSWQFKHKKWKNQLSVQYQTAKNNFKYSYRNVDYIRQNAQTKLLNITDNISFTLNDKVVLLGGIWITSSERGSPNSLIPISPYDNFLEDKNLKAFVGAQLKLKKGKLNVTQGFLSENQRFWNDVNLDSQNDTRASVSKVNYVFGKTHWKFLVGAENVWTKALGDSKQNASQNNTALFGSAQFTSLKFKGVFALREELIDKTFVPLSPSLSIEYQFVPHWFLIGNLSYNFRYPTLNDRFWVGAGNPDLLPEQGWSYETGFNFKQTGFGFRAVYFQQNLENFIQWVPLSGIWSPQNLKEIRNRGLDANASYSRNMGRVEAGIKVGYVFTESITLQSHLPNDASVGKQLIYVPEHRFTTQFNMAYAKVQLLYNVGYTSGVFANADHNPLSSINPFWLHNLELNYRLELGKARLKVNFALLNLTNKKYETIKNYPMPGVNFKTGITLMI